MRLELTSKKLNLQYASARSRFTTISMIITFVCVYGWPNEPLLTFVYKKQVAFWIFWPNLSDSQVAKTQNFLRICLLFTTASSTIFRGPMLWRVYAI